MANERLPVVFIHGMWLHPDSWHSWMGLFRERGFEPLNPGWPGDSQTVDQARRHPERLANLGIEEATRHFVRIIDSLDELPILVGHSFGGLIAQKLLGLDLARACVAISPMQFRGVLPVPYTQLQSAFPVFRNPAKYRRTVMLTREQFHQGFANGVSDEESDVLHQKYVIPAPGRPVFEAALSNLNPRTPAKVETQNPKRGPLLIIAGGIDRTVPMTVARAAYRRYRKSPARTEFRVLPDRGHSMVVDHGWYDVATVALNWLERQGLRPEKAAAPGHEVPIEYASEADWMGPT